MKNHTFLQSIYCSINGVKTAFNIEKNFKVYFFHIIIFFIINFFLNISLIEFLLFFICIFGVLSSECLNTAIEQICNFIENNKNDKIKIIKDIAAGGVFYWGLAFYILEISLVVKHLNVI